MATVRLSALIGKDRKLVVQLPDDIQPGEVELIVRSPQTGAQPQSVPNPAREAARAKLLAAGALVTEFQIPENAVRLTVEERMQIGKLPTDARTSLDLINEDRGEW